MRGGGYLQPYHLSFSFKALLVSKLLTPPPMVLMSVKDTVWEYSQTCVNGHTKTRPSKFSAKTTSEQRPPISGS